jgi:hypothetical protein
MRRILLAAAVVGLSYATCATKANAQFSFGYADKNWGVSVGPSMGYGGGYGGYGRGYGAYPYGAYPNGYGNYRNYGNYGPQYHVHVPTQSYRSRSSGSYSRRSVAPMQVAQPVGDGLPIKIVCPDDAGTSLKYSLNEYDYEIKPGESQTLVNNRRWVITFDRGGEFGTAQYSMSAGIYTFALTAKGWDVYHDADVSKLTKKSSEKSTAAKNEIPARK